MSNSSLSPVVTHLRLPHLIWWRYGLFSLDFDSSVEKKLKIQSNYSLSGFVLLIILLAFPVTGWASPNLSITPLTWNVVGLDSNNVNVGPNNFPVGARVCNTGDAASNVVGKFIWESGGTDNGAYIDSRPGSLTTINVGTLEAGTPANPKCYDFYFEVNIKRDSDAYNKTRRYYIQVSGSGFTTLSTPRPREIYVEKLISQNRNSTDNVSIKPLGSGSYSVIANGGTMSLAVGSSYTIKLDASTATQGYNQLESFINFPNTVFQILAVRSLYSANSSGYVSNSSDKLYSDACLWDMDPASDTYHSCIGSDGKAGGTIQTEYDVKVVAGAGSTQPLNTLIYDYSGSSFHYNSDFSSDVRFASITSPLGMSKSFSPASIAQNGTSTLTISISNPTSDPVSGVSLTDTLPTGVTISGSPATPQCGGAISSTAGSITLTNGTIPAGGCTIMATVTSSTLGTYANTTGSLKINGADTGITARANLIVETAPSGSCTPVTIANWTIPTSGTSPPTFTSRDGGVTALAFTNATTSDISSGYWNNKDALNKTSLDLTTDSYFRFQIGTGIYSNVKMTFTYYNSSNNGPKKLDLYYGNSTTNLAALTQFGQYVPGTIAATQTNLDFSNKTNTSGDTYFYLYPWGATNAATNNYIGIKDITFTGCRSSSQTIEKTFSPNPIQAGQASTLTFTLRNAGGTPVTGTAAFTDTLPGGLTIANTPPPVNNCGGTLTATAGSSTINLSVGAIPAGGSCTITVPVTAATAGSYPNVSGYLSANNAVVNSRASATLTILDPPVISKSFATNPIYTGGTSSLIFTITNPNADADLSGVTFTDTFPAGLNLSGTPTPSQCGGGTVSVNTAASPHSITLTGGTLSAKGSCTLTVTTTAATTGSFLNTSGAVSATSSGQTLTGNTASDTLGVRTTQPGIAILKQVSTSRSGPWASKLNVAPSDTVYYRLTVENTGDVPLTSISVTDNIPAYQTLITNTCTWPTTLPVASATVDPTASCIIGPVTADASAVTNTASASGVYNGTTYNSPDTPLDSATYQPTVLLIDKTATQTSFSNAGDTINYTYTVTNRGDADLSTGGATATTVITDTNTVATCTLPGDSTLSKNESFTCTATYTVTAFDVSVGSVTNTAWATVGGVRSNMDRVTVYKNAPDLVVSKTDNRNGYPSNGATFNWTITVANQGPQAATFSSGQTIVSDQLPITGATYDSPSVGTFSGITNSGNIACAINGSQILTCTASGAVEIGGTTGSFSVTIPVTPTATGGLVNAAARVDPGNSVTESNEGNNTGGSAVTVLASAPGFTLSGTVFNDLDGSGLKNGSEAGTNAGGLYVLLVNGSGNVAGHATVSGTDGTFSLTGVSAGNYTLRLSAIDQASGAAPAASLPLGWVNTGESLDGTTAESGGTAKDGNLAVTISGAISGVTFGIQQQTDLVITKTDGSATYTPGSAITYTIVVSNNGPANATGVSVADTVPAAITVSSIGCVATGTANCGTNASSGNSLSYTGASIAAGASNYLTFMVSGTVAAGTTGNLTNTATVTAGTGQSDPASGNNSATDTNTQAAASTFTVSGLVFDDLDGSGLKNGSEAGTDAGGLHALLVNTATGNVVASTAVTSGTGAFSFSGVTNGSYTVRLSTATGTVGQAPPDASLPIGWANTGESANDTSTDGTADGSLAVSVSGADQTALTFGVRQAADLVVQKDGPVQAVSGTTVTYTARVYNAGPAAANGASFSDPAPANLGGMAWTCGNATGGAVCPQASGSGAINQTIATFPSGGGLTYTITGTLGGSVTNVASVNAPTGLLDPSAGNNSDTVTTTVGGTPSVLDLAVVKTGPTTAATNGSVTWIAVVSNAGPAAANGAVFSDPVPANLVVGSMTWTCGKVTGGAVCPNANGSGAINETIATFPAGSSLTYTISGTMPETGTVTNVASVTAPSGVLETDALSNNTASVSTSVGTTTVNADLALVKTGPATVAAGATVIYSLLVSNTGPDAVSNARVLDTTPLALTNIAWTCGSPTGGGHCDSTGDGGDPDTTVDLPAGATVTINVTGDAPSGGSFANLAAVLPPAGTSDPDPTNNPGGPVMTQMSAVTLSGTVFNDNGAGASAGNGIKDSGESGVNPGGLKVVVVSDLGDDFLAVAAVDNATGTWSAEVPTGIDYRIYITTDTVTVGGAELERVSLPAGWSITGETSTNTGNDGTADGILALATVNANATTLNFGIRATAPDMTVTLALPAAGSPGATDVTGTLTCSNSGSGAASSVTCTASTTTSNATVTVGTCTPSSGTATSLPAGATLTCPVTVTMPGTASGGDTTATTVAINATTDASNDGDTTNNAGAASVAVIDAVDDGSATLTHADSGTATTAYPLLSNDTVGASAASVGAGGTVTQTITGITKNAATFTNNGDFALNATDGALTVKHTTAVGAYVVTYQICANPATTPAACDTATKTITVSAALVSDLTTAIACAPDPATAGAPVTCTLTCANSAGATDAATGVSCNFTGTLPTGATASGCPATATSLAIGASLSSCRLTFTPTAPGTINLTGSALATNEGNTANNSSSHSLTVSAPSAPSAANDRATANINTPVTLLASANDSAGAGGTLDLATLDLDPATDERQTSVTVAGEGTFTAANDGTVTFTPVTGFQGVVTVPYTIADSLGQTSNRANLTVTVRDTAAAAVPAANPDQASTPLNTAVTLAVLTNDAPGTGNTLTLSSVVVSGGTNGTWTANSNGTVTYTPTAGFAGVATANYTVKDSANGTSNSATLTVTVTGGATPLARDDSGATALNTPITLAILNNDLAGSGQTLAPATVDLAPGGSRDTTVTQSGIGTWTVSDTGLLTFTPVATFTGTATLSYTVQDSGPGTSNAATVTVIVNPTAAPTAVNDSANTAFNTAVTLTPASNDAAATGATLNAGTVDLDTTTAGVQRGPVTVSGVGAWEVIDNAGTVRFTPASGFTGTATRTYAISDSLGHTATATLSVTVAPPGAPVAANDSGTTVVNTALTQTTSILANDTGTGLVLTSVAGTACAAGCTVATAHGSVTVAANGTYVYTPANGYSGTDSFTYRIRDTANQTADGTVNLTVTPTAANDGVYAATAGTPTTGGNANLLTNDAGSGLTVVSVNGTACAAGCTVATAHGTVTVNANGTFAYTADAGYVGADSFVYVARDAANQLTGSATVSFSVSAALRSDLTTAIACTPDPAMAGAPVTCTLTCANSAGATAAATDASCNFTGTLPAGATASGCPATTDALAIGASLSSCSLTFTPAAPGTISLTGSASATNEGNTANNDSSHSLTVSAAINPVTDSGSVTTGLGGIAIANVAANDTINGAPATLGTGGNATVAVSGSWPSGITLDPSTGAISVAATVTPGVYPVSYQLCDRATPTPHCATVEDSVTVTAAINPVADSGTVTTGIGGTAIANVAANDTINGAPATLGTGGNATVAVSGTWPSGITLDPSTGAISVAATVAPGVYPVSYQLCDRATPTPHCATVEDSVTVTAVINPVTESGTVTTGIGGTAIANVATNDTINGAPATLGTGGNATVAVSGSWPDGITLDPSTGAISVAPTVAPGVYPVSYQLCDRATPPNCATVEDTVTVNTSRPIAADDGVYAATAGVPTSGDGANLLTNDTGANLTIAGVNGIDCITGCTVATTHGTVTVDANGTFSYTADVGYSGTDSFVYVARDASGQLTNSATVSFEITAAPAPDLTLTKQHAGDFEQGQSGAVYTLTVSNLGTGPTTGVVTVTDLLPTGLTATDFTGEGWACTLEPQLSCSREDPLAAGASYPALTLTVDVAAETPTSLINTASVSGGGDINPDNDTAEDETRILGLNGRVSGLVFADLDGDGRQGPGEPGIPGVLVTLTSTGDGSTSSETLTDAGGRYRFDPVAPGTYDLLETDPPRHTSTTLNNIPVSVAANGTVEVDFGDQPLGTISGRVFEDLNGDGLINGDERGLSGVTLTLTGNDGTIETTATTDVNGLYLFDPVSVGGYSVRETDPDGYVSTTLNLLPIRIQAFVLDDEAVASAATANFGDQRAASITGRVFADINGDGLQDGGELGISGVSVELRGSSDTLIAQTGTATDGSYRFDDVLAGTYTVVEIDPSGWFSTTSNRVSVNLATGSAATANFGDQRRGTVSGRVFRDLDGNGEQGGAEYGLADVTVTLRPLSGSGTSSTTTTDSAGEYRFELVPAGAYEVFETDPVGYVSTTDNSVAVSLAAEANGQVGAATANFGDQPQASISGRVFMDLSGNGVQEQGESGLGGIIVTLERDGVVLDTALTSGNGAYLFDGLAPGVYSVERDDIPDYLATSSTPVTVSLVADGSATANFGVQPIGLVHGQVVIDTNGNGSVDSGEAGVGGIRIELLEGNTIFSGWRAWFGLSASEASRSEITAGDGRYLFLGVRPGNYSVEATPPEDLINTTPISQDVTVTETTPGRADFGLIRYGSITGRVFQDLDFDDLDDEEPGLGGVSIELADRDGISIATTQTSGDGHFLFEDLDFGDYVLIETDPIGFASTPGLNRVELTLDEERPAANANFPDRVNLVTDADLMLTKTVDERTPVVGEVVTFTLRVVNQGPADATDVRVVEQLPSGYADIEATPSEGSYDAGTGIWAIGALANGEQATLTLSARVLGSGSYTNNATVSANEPDPNVDNNIDAVTPQPVAAPPTSSHSIPTLSEWAVLLLLALMMMVGLRHQRRR